MVILYLEVLRTNIRASSYVATDPLIVVLGHRYNDL